jgi:hypothetical protein
VTSNEFVSFFRKGEDMKRSNPTLTLTVVLFIVLVCCSISLAEPLGTSFIYQGSLTDANLPATGLYDLQFMLFDDSDPNDSNQVGVTNSFFDVLVDNNSFTIELDFVDANSSVQEVWGDGQSRWLEIGARYKSLPLELQGFKPYTIIKPRQKIMPVPFALYALSAGTDSNWIISDNNMYSDISGNIGIGKTNPHYKLDVAGTINGLNNFYAGVIGQSLFDPGVYGYSGTYAGVYGYGDSIYGIGLFGESYSGLAVYGYSFSNIGVVGDGGYYDFLAVGPGVNYGTVSSIRWKRDIRLIDEPLDKVMNLRGVYFNWDKEHGGRHDIGMIAEEVGQVLPEIVAYEPDGEYASGMDYGKLTPLLVEAVKALKTENDSLKKRIEALEKQCSAYSVQRTETTER